LEQRSTREAERWRLEQGGGHTWQGTAGRAASQGGGGGEEDVLGEALQARRTVAGGNSFPAGGVVGRRRSRRGRALPGEGASLRAASQGGGGRGGEEDELGGALQAGTSVAGGNCFPAGVVAGRRRSRRARAGA